MFSNLQYLQHKCFIPLWRVTIFSFLGAFFMALMAQKKLPIPGTALQLSLQSLSVSLLVIIFQRKALWAVVFYLVLATLGFAVLADGSSDPNWFGSIKAGYYWGFLLASWVVGSVLATVRPHRFVKIWFCLSLNETLILFCGFLLLSYHFGFKQAWWIGVWPYILGALGKITFAALVYKFISLKRKRRQIAAASLNGINLNKIQ